MAIDINQIIHDVSAVVSGWPFIFFLIGVAISCTIMFGFVQFRYFGKAWLLTLFPKKQGIDKAVALSPLQACLNNLSTNLRNGTFTGAFIGSAMAICMGGSFSIFWFVWLFFSFAVFGILASILKSKNI